MEDEQTYPRNGFQTLQMKWRVKAMQGDCCQWHALWEDPQNNLTIWAYREKADSALKNEKKQETTGKS